MIRSTLFSPWSSSSRSLISLLRASYETKSSVGNTITRAASTVSISSSSSSTSSSQLFLSVPKTSLCGFQQQRRRQKHEQKRNIHHDVYVWGQSKKGVIPIPPAYGNDSKTMFDHPNKIDIDTVFGFDKDDDKRPTIKQFACGHTTSAAVFDDGRCFTWGSNGYGELGLSDTNDRLKPTPLPPNTPPISSITLGPTATALLTPSGQLYSCGNNGSALRGGMGLLGHGPESPPSLSTPTLIASLIEDECHVTQVSLGESHATVLTKEGEVLTAGAGSYGRLGNLEPIDQVYLEPVEMLSNESIVAIAGGHAFSLALTQEGVVYAWGRNDKGQLGVGGGMMVDIYAMENLPRVLEGQLEGRRVVSVAAGYAHSAAVTDNGELFVWGMGMYLEPMMVSTIARSGQKCVDVACGQNYTMILTDQGYLYSFGKNKTGVLGHAHTQTLNQPELVEGLRDKVVLTMDAGLGHFACVVRDRTEDDN